jgi:dephospho-CoA kinase
MRLIGLTGGIACGKSTVSSALVHEHHLAVVDADALAHSVCKRGRWGYRRVLRAFGPSILNPVTKEIDRDALAQIAFSDPIARRRLNKATHLPIALALALALLKHWLLLQPLVIVDMPLLFETNSDRFASATIVITADEATQLKRLRERDGMEEEHARRRVAAQMPSSERERRATVVLRNESTREALLEQVEGLVKEGKRGSGPLRRSWGRAVATWPPALCFGGWALWRVLVSRR